MPTESNSINAATTGIVGNTGTAFTGTAMTNHAVLVGGATSSTITNLSVGATGTVLAGSTGADPAFTATPTVTSISFGGTALSNYTEGTWTPTMVGSGTAGTTTYTVQQGYYTRIGNMVTIWGNVQGSAATGTGTAIFGSFPFTIKNQADFIPTGSFTSQSAAGWTFPTGATSLAINGTSNTITGFAFVSGTAGAGNFLQMANAAFSFQFTMSYQI